MNGSDAGQARISAQPLRVMPRGGLGQEQLQRAAAVGGTPTPATALDEALRTIGQKEMEIGSLNRALAGLRGETTNLIQRISEYDRGLDAVCADRVQIIEEWAAALAIIHNALPDTTGRIAQADLAEMRAAIAELAEVAFEYHTERHNFTV